MKKQIVLIMTDTQRWDMLNCNVKTGLSTPCLDEIAKNGMNFKQAYTTQPVCGPARSALFTGTYPHTNGMWANSMALGDNVKTIGQRLQDNDIKTAYIGKWHLDGGDYFGLGTCPDGWAKEYWFDMRNYLETMSEEDILKSRDMTLMDKEIVKKEFTYGYQVTMKALDFLEKHKNEDFLLVVSYDEPHHPFICPNKYYDMYSTYEFDRNPSLGDSLKSKSPHYAAWAGDSLLKKEEDFNMNFQAFFGCQSYVDSLIGNVYQSMKKYTPDALGLFTSDHGDALYNHKINNKGPSSYDCIAKIPFIAWHQKLIKKQSVYSYPSTHIDVVPTIMDYMGLPIPKILEGISLLPALYEGTKTNKEIFIEYGRYEIDHDGFGGFQPMRAIFDGQYKLTIFLEGTDELYNLDTDPFEMNNLIVDKNFIKTRNKLHDHLLDWMNKTRDPFRGYCWERRPWRSDARKATWDYTSMTRQRENEEYEPKQLDYLTGLEIKEATRKK